MFLLKAYDRLAFGDKIDTTIRPNWSGNLDDLLDAVLEQLQQLCEAQIAADKAKELEAGAAVPAAEQTINVKPQTT